MKDTTTQYQPIIGLEIHVELKTLSKMFCGCKNDPFFARKPNCYTCPVCLGMPGGLPVANRKAVEWTIMLGLALGCEIPLLSKFDRKNYFYPDLAKGYQISQYDQPLAINGMLKFQMTNDKSQTEAKTVRIQRVHLEEDTGKLLHSTVNGKKVTLVDFNRSGVPLVEIVTEPDIHSAEEAKAFLKKLRQIIRYLDISDADMEKGSMRLEPNISVRQVTKDTQQAASTLPPYKVEVKNINSFNFVKRAIEFEVKRQVALLDRGERPVQETRGWNEGKAATYTQRIKEEADDYRYFPEPDIPPIRWTKEHIDGLRNSLPELPDMKIVRFKKTYGLNDYDTSLLTDTPQLADYFEECVRVAEKQEMKDVTPKKVANWIINRTIDIGELLPAQLIRHIDDTSHATEITDKDLEKVVRQVLRENQKAVDDYRKGKKEAFMFIVGKARNKLRQVDYRKLTECIKQNI